MPKTNIFEQFLMLFDAVKSAASNEPSRIQTFYMQHDRLRTAVDEFVSFMSFGDFERRVFHSRKKYHPQTPEAFQEAFKNYRENWE